MIATSPEPSASDAGASALSMFDTGAAATFGWLCRLVDGDRDLAEQLLADVYAELGSGEHTCAAAGSPAAHDLDVLRIAFALAEQTGGSGELSVRDRALLDLHVVQGRDHIDIASVLGVQPDTVASLIDTARQAFAGLGSDRAIADVLADSERWLDDRTRRRARLAIGSSRSPNRQRPSVRTSANQAAPLGSVTGLPDGAAWRSPADVAADRAQAARQALPPTGPTDARRSRRLMVGLAAGIAALLGLGAVWIAAGKPDTEAAQEADGSTPGSDASDPSPITDNDPTTTVDEVRTRPPLTVTQRPPTRPGYVLAEAPAGFQALSVWDQPVGIQLDGGGAFELWAEPGSSRTVGRWFAVRVTARDDDVGIEPEGSVRILLGDGLGVMSTGPDGVSTVRVDGATASVRLLAHGFDAPSLQQIVAGLDIGAEIVPSSESAWLRFDPATAPLLSGLDRVGFGSEGCCWIVPGGARATIRSVAYTLGTGLSTRFLAITTVDGVEPSNVAMPRTVSRYVDTPSPDPQAPIEPLRTVTIGERDVYVTGSSYTASSATHVFNRVEWMDGDEIVSIDGEVDLATLYELVAGAELASSAEWDALSESSRTRVDPMSTVEQEPEPRYVSLGEIELDASAWTAAVSDDPVLLRLWVNVGGASSGSEERLVVDPARPVHEFASAAATVLLIALRDPGTGTSVRISVADREPVTLPLTAVGDSGLVAAFDAFTQLPPYTVELVDANGAVVRPLAP